MQAEVENRRWQPLTEVYMENVHLSLQTRLQRNSNGYTHVFGVGQHDWTSVNIVQRQGKIEDGGRYQVNDGGHI
jgi:hypothetical protein